MKKICISLVLLFTVFDLLFGCTGFYISKGAKIFAGNNEDFDYPLTKMWVVPASENELGRIYFGYDDFSPQGGINEKGLFFDGFATDKFPVKDISDKPNYNKFFADIRDEIMATCENVGDVITLLSKYNLSGNGLFENGMLLYGDAGGNSIIVDGGHILMKKGDYQVITNFHLYNHGKITDSKYLTATRLLKKMTVPGLNNCRDVLDSAHVPLTLYSQVYDITNMKIYLYNFHNFSESHVINIRTLLKEGPAYYDIPAFFKYSKAYEAFKEKHLDERYMAAFEKRYNTDIGKMIDPEYLGRYKYLSYKEPGADIVYVNDSLYLITVGINNKGIFFREDFSSRRQFSIFPQTHDLYFNLARAFRTDLVFKNDDELEIIAETYYPVYKWVMKLKKYKPDRPLNRKNDK